MTCFQLQEKKGGGWVGGGGGGKKKEEKASPRWSRKYPHNYLCGQPNRRSRLSLLLNRQNLSCVASVSLLPGQYPKDWSKHIILNHPG